MSAGIRVAPVVTALLEGADWELERRRARAVAEAKDAVRAACAERIEDLIDAWEQDLDETGDETTRSAPARADAVEQDLFAQLTSVRQDPEIVAGARRTLDAFVTAAIASGHAEVD